METKIVLFIFIVSYSTKVIKWKKYFNCLDRSAYNLQTIEGCVWDGECHFPNYKWTSASTHGRRFRKPTKIFKLVFKWKKKFTSKYVATCTTSLSHANLNFLYKLYVRNYYLRVIARCLSVMKTQCTYVCSKVTSPHFLIIVTVIF